MIQKYVIGIDVSKSKLDCAIMDFNLLLFDEKSIANNQKSIGSFISTLIKKLAIDKNQLVICCENTGIYNRPLELVCSVLGITLWVEHALKIKRASIDMRGKDDKKDALRIAEYCIRYIDKLVPFKEPSKIVQEISHLSKSRETLLTQRVAIENQLKEAETHDNFEYKILSKTYRATLRTLTKSIKKIEALIETLIDQDDEIKETRNLLVSIPGIGKQCAIHLIITTDNFTRFDNANHLACYAGVARFKNESGKIVKRARVSKMANKNIKRLLHMAAMAAIKSNPQLKTYFKRKVEEGKNKMSVLNAVRNKLVHRIMAVISRKTPYLPQEVFLLK